MRYIGQSIENDANELEAMAGTSLQVIHDVISGSKAIRFTASGCGDRNNFVRVIENSSFVPKHFFRNTRPRTGDENRANKKPTPSEFPSLAESRRRFFSAHSLPGWQA